MLCGEVAEYQDTEYGKDGIAFKPLDFDTFKIKLRTKRHRLVANDYKMEEFVKNMGFDSLEEFNNLNSSIDISTELKLLKYIEWKEKDGTKDGLLELINNLGAMPIRRK